MASLLGLFDVELDVQFSDSRRGNNQSATPALELISEQQPSVSAA
jgi:hypothetical protein